MRIEQLEYIAAVTHYGSLRRASEQLHISQPALSEAVAKLERELGVTLLDRKRSGARISREGRELLGSMVEVLEAVDRLRAAAGSRETRSRVVRVGTVNAGTASMLFPAMKSFQREHPGTAVEIRNLQQDDIRTGLVEGALDLGLVNLLDGDDVPPDLIGTRVQRGRPVAVVPAGHRLAAQDEVSVDDLRSEPFVAMRAGYLMHRFAHRLFGTALPRTWHVTDGAEMGKMMVAEGLGITLLPDFSVHGDTLERVGLIAARPVAGDRTAVTMVALQTRNARPSTATEALYRALTEQVDSSRTAS